MERTIKFASLRAPDAPDLEALKGWLQQQRLCDEENGHLLRGTDFVALVDKQEECWLDTIVEHALTYFPRGVGSFIILVGSDFTNCARVSLLRQSSVV